MLASVTVPILDKGFLDNDDAKARESSDDISVTKSHGYLSIVTELSRLTAKARWRKGFNSAVVTLGRREPYYTQRVSGRGIERATRTTRARVEGSDMGMECGEGRIRAQYEVEDGQHEAIQYNELATGGGAGLHLPQCRTPIHSPPAQTRNPLTKSSPAQPSRAGLPGLQNSSVATRNIPRYNWPAAPL
jgi:hypothetical protein